MMPNRAISLRCLRDDFRSQTMRLNLLISSMRRRRRHLGGCCSKGTKCRAVGAFLLVVVVFVPVAVFTLSAFFTTILWGVECAESTAEEWDTHGYDLCSWYEWFKYVVGNLVGVGLTSIGDEISGHALAEMVDILVATWSVSVTGAVVGLVGGLSLMNLMTEMLDVSVETVNATSDDIRYARAAKLAF